MRQVDLDTIPASIVGSVAINKTLSANQDGDAIGGSVLEGFGKRHGLVWVAESGRLFVTDGAKGELGVYAGTPLKRIQTIPLAEDADGLFYDGATKLLYAGYGGTNAAYPSRIAVVDTTSLRLRSTIRVASHPEGLELRIPRRSCGRECLRTDQRFGEGALSPI